MISTRPRLALPPLYAIFDPEQTRGRPADRVLRELCAGGVRLLQLRAKALSPRAFFQVALEARALTRIHAARLIVNDRVDIALACDADGVHLGQEDMPLQAARKLMRDKLIGISTHSPEQARAAETGGADYIGFGPVFSTTTKATGYPARGLTTLRELHGVVRLPVVAIGGITENNVREVWQAGADSAAIISDILGAPEMDGKIKRILALAPPG